MTPQMIPARGTPLVGASYEFIDRAKQQRGTTLYYLEDIDTNGMVTRHGPVAIEFRGAFGSKR